MKRINQMSLYLMSKKMYTFGLFVIFSLVSTFSFAHEEGHNQSADASVTMPVVAQKHDALSINKAETLQPLSIDNEDLKEIWQKLVNDHVKKIFQKRQELLLLLPEETQQFVVQANDMYENLVAHANIGNNLVMICEKMRIKLPAVQKNGLISQEQCDALAKGLEKF